MSGAKMDTSGAVNGVPNIDGDPCRIVWDDLDAFTQGYVEALIRDADVQDIAERARPRSRFDQPYGFSDLAPETLARIIADCEAFTARHPGWNHPDGGRLFWAGRNGDDAKADSLFGETCRASFPPLTVHLNDDGKVVFA